MSVIIEEYLENITVSVEAITDDITVQVTTEKGKNAFEVWLETNAGGTLEQYNAYIKGEAGYTPVKGTDYFDGADGYTPVKGVDYFDGEQGIKGVKGDDAIVGGFVESGNTNAVSGDAVFSYVGATNYTKAETDAQFATKIEDPLTDDQVLVKNADGSYRYEPYGGGGSAPTGMDGHDTYLI